MTTYKKPDSDIKKATRVNATVETHLFPMKPLKPTKRYASVKTHGTATANTTPILAGLYDGKELRPFEGRPGAMDFKKCPSKGF